MKDIIYSVIAIVIVVVGVYLAKCLVGSGVVTDVIAGITLAAIMLFVFVVIAIKSTNRLYK